MIGYGSPNKSGSHDCHGAPLGEDEIKASREFLGWTGDAFEIPADIYSEWDGKEKGKQLDCLLYTSDAADE